MQEGAEREAADADDDHERRERAESMNVVGGAEAAAARERIAEAELLDRRRRHGKAHEGEPGDPRQDVDSAERRERREDEKRDEHGSHRGRCVEHEMHGS